MTPAPDDPLSAALAACRCDDAGTREGEQGRKPEQGPSRSARAVPIVPSDVSAIVPDPATAGAELAAMRAQFIADFAGGTMGRRHNTYEHRARILRQLARRPSP